MSDIDDIAESLDDKDEFTKECLTCSAPTFEKVRSPEFHAHHEAAWTTAWEKHLEAVHSDNPPPHQFKYLTQLFDQELQKFGYKKSKDWSGYYWEKSVTEGLDDKDEFIHTDIFCDRCHNEVEETFPIDPNWPQYSQQVCKPCLDILNQGPPDDKWLAFYEGVQPPLDDKDEFNRPDRCERCNSTHFVEPVYFNNTSENLCRWCAKELFIDISYHLGESLEDKDEFGTIPIVNMYEESGPDYVKILTVFEDGARLYWQSNTYTDYDGRSAWYNSTKIKLPSGELQSFGYDPEVPVPDWAAKYIESMDFNSENERRLPFPQPLLKEFNLAMTLTESLEDKDEFAHFEESPIRANLIWPLGMDVNQAIQMVQSHLDMEVERIGQIYTAIAFTPHRYNADLLIYLTPEECENIKEQFGEQYEDNELSSVHYRYSASPSAIPVELEIRHTKNEWMFRVPEPVEPDDDWDPPDPPDRDELPEY